MDNAWFVQGEDGRIVIDPDLAYPKYLAVIGAKKPSVRTLELARRVFTEDLRQTLGAPLHLVIAGKDRRWALKHYRDETGKDEEIVRRSASHFEQFYKSLPGTPASRAGFV